MKFLRYGNDHDDYWRSFDEYKTYVDSIRNGLPRGARQYLDECWSLAASDHRSLHDAWVESLEISEIVTALDRQHRQTNARVVLLGPYHDYRITLLYEAVQGYDLRADHESMLPMPRWGHGDWLVDELTLSERGLIVHEVLFSTGARWRFEALDLTCVAVEIAAQAR